MRLCLLLGLVLCCSSVFAGLPETPQFRQSTVADGLPSSTLYAVTQDKKGFIWIASKDGLARYDGVGYKIYRYAPGDDNALPGNVVQALHVDDRDQLWIAIEGQGISRLNAERTNFTHFRKSMYPAMGSDDVWAMTTAKDGSLWFGTYAGGLHHMDSRGQIKRYMPVENDPDSLPSDTILSLTIDIKGRIWVGTTKGLCIWDGKKFTVIKNNQYLNTFVMQLINGADGSVWAGTKKGLVHLSPDGKQIGEVLLPDNAITGLWQDQQGAIWFSNGAEVFEWTGRQLLSYTPDSQTPANIYGVFEDHVGGFWFPTQDRGLLRLPAGWRNFSIFRHQSQNKNSLSGEIVRSAADAGDNSAWLVSFGGGLDKINLADGHIKQVLENNKDWNPVLLSVLQTHDGSVWMGHTKGMSRLDSRSSSLKHFFSGDGQQGTLHGGVRLLIQTPDDLIWSASYGVGIQARDEDGHVVHTIIPNDGKGLLTADTEQFAVSPEGKLWVATAQGLLRWDDAAGKFLPVLGSPAERIDAFCFLSADTVWVHRVGMLEAFQWDGRKLQSIRKITGDHGLPPVEAGSMLPDRSGNLWLTTTRGLLRYNPLTNQIRMFGERDGLPSQEFDMQPALLASNGMMLASTTKGLVVFDPAKIRNQKALSPLVIDGISVRRGDDKIFFPASSSTIELQWDDRDLDVNVRLLSFSDAPAHRYRFLLEAYDSDWVDTGSQGERIFSSLPAGNYRLEAKATDAEGRWVEALKLKIVVMPPWWKTAWAKCLWLLLFSSAFLALAWLYRNRLLQLNEQRLRDQEREMAQQDSSAKSRFLATLGHEIRTPMTGVLGMAELLQASELEPQQRHRVTSIQTAGQHLLRLVNDVLDLAQIEAGKLRLHDAAFEVRVLIKEVSGLLKPLAEIKGLGFNVIVDKNTPDFCRGDVDRIRQILLNLGNNAIKFTEQGRVLMKCSGMLPNGLQLQMSDTGPGMSDDQQARLFQRFEQAQGSRSDQRYGGSGLGLAICQELAAAMNGHIQVKSRLGQGALFTVELPLQTALELTQSDVVAPKAVTKSEALTILLVEDDSLVAETLIGLMHSIGHEVVHVMQGLQALAALSTRHFDIALLDLDLPGIDGLELARLILAQGHRLPMAAITARADAQAEPDAMAAGMNAFIRKPVSAAELQDVLQTLSITGHSVLPAITTNKPECPETQLK